MNAITKAKDDLLEIIEAVPQIRESRFFPSVQLYMDNNEFSIAFEDLIETILIEKLPVSPWVAKKIKDYYLADGMENDPVVLKYLSSANFLKND